MSGNTVLDCRIIELDKHHSDRKGNLSVVENGKEILFAVKRVYYLYDVPGGESRGGHAHKALYQFIVAVSGSFSVTLDDGKEKETVVLNRPYQDFNYAVNKGYLSIEEVEFAWHKIKEVIRWLRPKRRTIWWRMVNKASKTVNKHLDSLLLKLE